MRAVAGATVAVVLAVLLALGSVASWAAHPDPRARVRFAWSARPERIEHCRRLTDEELAGIPAHMRERVHCEGRAARYRLLVRIEGAERLTETVRGGGARHEGMIQQLRDFPVDPGARRITIEVARIDSAAVGVDSVATPNSDRERRMEETRARVRREALPAEVRLDTTVVLSPREVVLVGYDPEGRRFQLVRRERRSP